MSGHTLLLLAQILAANIASAESRIPCVSAIADYCSGQNGQELHYCLARKRHHIDESCVDAVKMYYEQHPEETMPESEESDLKNEKAAAEARVLGSLRSKKPNGGSIPIPGSEVLGGVPEKPPIPTIQNTRSPGDR